MYQSNLLFELHYELRNLKIITSRLQLSADFMVLRPAVIVVKEKTVCKEHLELLDRKENVVKMVYR